MNEYEKLNTEIAQLAQHIVKTCTERGFKIATAESCTGGLISGAITAVAGSSAVIELGVCSYSNRIKQLTLGVSEKTLKQHSEYSAECAEEMAQGVRRLGNADLAVATTGVAGPAGGTDEHPVGEVYIAVRCRERVHCKRFVFKAEGSDPRTSIRLQAVRKALMLLELMVMTEV